MAEPRGRRTGEHNPLIVKLLDDAAQMRAQLAALQARVERLEAEAFAARKGGAKPGASPPPLPRVSRSIPVPVPRPQGRKSVVDISEIAELVESLPPPPSRGPRK